MAFALFDSAALLLYPWAVIFHELRLFGFLEMLLFLALVSAGFVYFWKKGVFDWGEPESEENS
jgi:NADH-quinone oxidoreductase subunit A